MGGGQDQESVTSARFTPWDSPWESDGENIGLVYVRGGVSSECDEDEVQGSAAPCITSVAQPYEKDNRQVELRRRILRNGEPLATRETRRQMRSKLNRYIPGNSIAQVGRAKGSDRVIPDMTTLLVVGFKGAGKSSLINDVIRVLCNKPSGFYRAQVSDDPCENGTYFMGEYKICSLAMPRVCLFDTRGLPEDDTSTAMRLLEGWMKDGIRHGQMDLRASDSSSTKESLEKRGRHGDHQFSRKRNVNFVIFVINAVSVFKMKERGDVKQQAKLVKLYKNPYLTFKDDRPVIAMTHGDKLSNDDRTSTRIYLGEILGVPPVEQIFDTAGPSLGWTGTTTSNRTEIEADTSRDITVLNMLDFALDCADRNLPYKKSSVARLKAVFKAMAMNYEALDNDRKVYLCGMITCIYILLVLSITACSSLALFFNKRKKRWW